MLRKISPYLGDISDIIKMAEILGAATTATKFFLEVNFT
jgi:hypothetical protein